MTELESLFDSLWHDYAYRLCPSALKVHEILARDGRPTVNDHIALRTFASPQVGLDKLAKHFIALGYRQVGEYHFAAKKLYAHHYQHADETMPKVFISELRLEQCDAVVRDIIEPKLVKLADDFTERASFLYQGRPWDIELAQYELLTQYSEYAAWVFAHGFGANHFTVSVNHLQGFAELEQVNQFLTWHDFALNQAGGEVKGSPEVGLEQSATLADQVKMTFLDGDKSIPGGFYEFALRHPDQTGSLYQGFVTESADKIFESTNSHN